MEQEPEDEYEYVLVEIPELHESDCLRACREFEITGLGGSSPKLVLDSLTFRGTAEDTVGTQVFFRVPPAGAEQRAAGAGGASVGAGQVPGGARKRVRDGAGGQAASAACGAQFVCSSTKRIRFTLQRDADADTDEVGGGNPASPDAVINVS